MPNKKKLEQCRTSTRNCRSTESTRFEWQDCKKENYPPNENQQRNRPTAHHDPPQKRKKHNAKTHGWVVTEVRPCRWNVYRSPSLRCTGAYIFPETVQHPRVALSHQRLQFMQPPTLQWKKNSRSEEDRLKSSVWNYGPSTLIFTDSLKEDFQLHPPLYQLQGRDTIHNMLNASFQRVFSPDMAYSTQVIQ